MKRSPYIKPLFWTLTCFALAICVILIVIFPLPGLLVFFTLSLIILLLILLKPDFWAQVRPGWKLPRRKKETEEIAVERTFQPTMMLESCAEGDMEVIKITSADFTLGRGGDNDHVFVGKPSISSHHARILYREDTNFYYIEDLGSRNGTWINARRLGKKVPTLLKNGTVVAFDQYRYIFRKIGR